MGAGDDDGPVRAESGTRGGRVRDVGEMAFFVIIPPRFMYTTGSHNLELW